MKNNSSTLILLIIILFLSISVKSTKMADNSQQSTNVYIVYTHQPHDNVEPESFHLSTLSSVLGSEDAAKDSLVYVYKNAATGFSAKLTPEQVAELEKKPGVIQIVESKPLKLHGGVGTMNMM